jgi:hypothetical protein
MSRLLPANLAIDAVIVTGTQKTASATLRQRLVIPTFPEFRNVRDRAGDQTKFPGRFTSEMEPDDSAGKRKEAQPV